MLWPSLVIIWTCVAVFIVIVVASVLDTLGIRKIPHPGRSKWLFGTMLVGIVLGGLTIWRNYTERGIIPVTFSTQSSVVPLDRLLEFPISEQQTLEIPWPDGKSAYLYAPNIDVNNQTAYFIVSTDNSAAQKVELRIHEKKQIQLGSQSYDLRLDGTINWKDRSDQAFISITPGKGAAQ